jgi:asparaginyl-tRNA synthetase
MIRTKVKDILKTTTLDKKVLLQGWVRTKRESKQVAFAAVNDGSCLSNIQVVMDPELFSVVLRDVTTGAAVEVIGTLKASEGSGQSVELIAEKISVLGKADPERYPLQPKRHSLEFLREIAHLRMRTNTFGAVFRIRHAVSFAVHSFFHERGFYHLHTPIITGSDAEGAGEVFKVTNFDLKNVPRDENGEVDFKEDFFGKETNLTVSGQLEGELGALALSDIYTFGPTFRAENSNTSRHLAEFWMIEPEMAFYDLQANIKLAEDLLKYVIQYVMTNCEEDLKFLDKRAADEEKNKPQQERSQLSLYERLSFVIENSFEQISYSQAIEILRNSKPNKKKKFEYLIEGWGTDLQSEHERFLVEKHFKKPVVIFDYPKQIKAFYMRQNDDNKTVAAMDILFPGIGEIVGGSQREERLEYLTERMKEMDIPENELWWYLETRKFGTVPHSGFGLGFERLLQFITGMGNIRDVIPFPRTPGGAEF